MIAGARNVKYNPCVLLMPRRVPHVERRFILETLSETEKKIVRLIVEGKSTREIAEELGYAKQTVRNYLCIVYEKVGVKNRTALVTLAFRIRLADTTPTKR